MPPAWEWWRYLFVSIGEGLIYSSALFLAYTCLKFTFQNPFGLESSCWIYVPGILFLFGLYMVRFLRHPFHVHEARLVDRTEVEALLAGANHLLQSADETPHNNHAEKVLHDLIDNKDGKDPSTWTEYRVLSIEQAMVKLLQVEDLIARTFARLEDLKEYNENKTPEEKEYFDKKIKRASKSIKRVQKFQSANDKDKLKKAVKNLRAELRMLLETLADFDKNWAVGSEILRELLIVVSFTIPIFLLMGITPVFVPPLEPMNFFSWALFGAAGSLTAVLRKIYLGNKVEVGFNEGKNELLRAIMGAILGLVSGFLIYMMFKSGIVTGGAILPDVDNANLKAISLSVFWAFMTGFTFEHFFDKAVQEHIGQSDGERTKSNE